MLDLKQRYQSQQIKAAIQVNRALLEFYWSLGRDIAERQLENVYGSGFYRKLSNDLRQELPDAKGFSPTNLKYFKYFYELYHQEIANRQQPVDDLSLDELFSIPWGHHIQKFGIDDVMGMTITKEIIPTKADVKDTDLSKFLIVEPEQFVYNPRTHGKKIGLGFNNTQKSFLISWNNAVFKVKDTTKVVPQYLYLILKQDIKICLIKNGYPPQYSPAVFRQIMGQVENFKEHEMQ